MTMRIRALQNFDKLFVGSFYAREKTTANLLSKNVQLENLSTGFDYTCCMGALGLRVK